MNTTTTHKTAKKTSNRDQRAISRRARGRAVLQYKIKVIKGKDGKTIRARGKRVQRYGSMAEASESTGIPKSSISMALMLTREDMLRHAGGYIWMYENETKKERTAREKKARVYLTRSAKQARNKRV